MEKKTFNEWCTSGSNRGTRGEVDEIKSKYNDFIDECIKKLENKKGASYKSLEQNDDRMSTYMSNNIQRWDREIKELKDRKI
jgi:hypothetical protein